MDAGDFKTELLTHLPRLRARAIVLSGSRTAGDDLLQDTLLRAWRFRERYQHGSSMGAWLHTIMRNVFYSAETSRKRTTPFIESEHGATLTTEAEQEWGLRYADLLRALQRLSMEAREALLLVVAQDLSYEAAAEVVGCPPGTMKSRVHRARKELERVVMGDPDAEARPKNHATARCRTQRHRHDHGRGLPGVEARA